MEKALNGLDYRVAGRQAHNFPNVLMSSKQKRKILLLKPFCQTASQGNKEVSDRL